MEIEQGLLRVRNIEDDVSGDDSGCDLSTKVCETDKEDSQFEPEPESCTTENSETGIPTPSK